MGSTVVTGDSIMNGYWVSLCKNLTCVNVPHWHMNRSRKRVSLLWFMSFPLLFFKCFCYFFASYCFAFEGVVVTCHVRIHKDLNFFCDLKMLRHIGFTKLPRPPPVLHRPFWDFGAPLSHRYELSTPVWLWSHSPGIPRYTSSPSPDNWSFQSDYISVWVIVELFSFQPNWLVSETFEKSSLHFQINRNLRAVTRWLFDAKFPPWSDTVCDRFLLSHFKKVTWERANSLSKCNRKLFSTQPRSHAVRYADLGGNWRLELTSSANKPVGLTLRWVPGPHPELWI